ncbi:transglycosylase SLT domain-containing protein [Roseobacter ponti]|uniref:Lytic transglycosylase domain-containing protein n=1 Tax=Roseobacter ponti TaxID=1891787 RepID=A0A858SZ98_9RHOB|nr:transglycosylase SLT domain-containing protein [Roseobacter ponti]QJF52973.1 lytic transglycosylase domain-containing protein [Roseobacter ponti]
MKFPLGAIVVLIFVVSLDVRALSAFQMAPGKSAGAICDEAAAIAARETGVPLRILKALTRMETGRNVAGSMAPWPWALNVEGKGFWFSSESETLSHLRNTLKNGSGSVDVGCFQVNLRWHGMAFSSLEEMLDPTKNAIYAASFLSDLYTETRDWHAAVGMYHSRTRKHATRYLSRFRGILAEMRDGTRAPPTPSPVLRKNSFPLLRTSDSKTAMGSLVPLSNVTGPGLFSN